MDCALYRVYERRLLNSLRPYRLPSHVGVILDGHRRFARAEGLADYTTATAAGWPSWASSWRGVPSCAFRL